MGLGSQTAVKEAETRARAKSSKQQDAGRWDVIGCVTPGKSLQSLCFLVQGMGKKSTWGFLYGLDCHAPQYFYYYKGHFNRVTKHNVFSSIKTITEFFFW